MEEEELAQQINHMLVQNQGLLQLKMSLGLEVATYRYRRHTGRRTTCSE